MYQLLGYLLYLEYREKIKLELLNNNLGMNLYQYEIK